MGWKPVDAGEVLCALTICLPSLVSLRYLYLYDDFDIYSYFVCIQSLIHAPFSIMFHISKSYGNSCYTGNGLILRRLDYTFIHIACILLSFGLSRSLYYGISGLWVNILFIHKIWTIRSVKQKPPIPAISFCILHYLVGILICQNVTCFMLCCVVCTVLYICTLFDVIGYAMMHTVLTILQYLFMCHVTK